MSKFKLPTIHSLEIPAFPKADKFKLSNGIPVYAFSDRKHEILRIDVVFEGGRWLEKKPLVADACARLFKSGTSTLSAFELDDAIDFLGGTIKASASYDSFTVSLYTLTKNLEGSLELLKVCLEYIIFPEHELDIQRENALSNLEIEQEKMDFVAEMAFKSMLFGKEHPYGYETTAERIKSVTTSDIKDFYKENFVAQRATVFMSGFYGERELNLLNLTLGTMTGNATALIPKEHPVISSAEKEIKIHKEGNVQSSIIIGNRSINRKDPNYGRFILLNAVFGGYFGSRLMRNIREEKGFTYGIYSILHTYKHDGVFFIQTDTAIENTNACIHEIYLEMDRLQNGTIEEYELLQARNYLAGKFLSRMDGSFQQMEVLKNYHIEGIDIEHFNQFAETLMTVTGKELQILAGTYFQRQDFYEVIAG